ncbi:MAG: TonB-dependent receptor [Halieaceae bacterium]|jgi:TonB-dependent receptor|nr:TonB-dependent receptor [Halieaceae bacterium]
MLPLTASAQSAEQASSAQSTVTGRVFDSRTGQSLRGAVVRVKGTDRRYITREDGRYQLRIPPGSATLEVEYVGSETQERDITLSAGVPLSVDVGLELRGFADIEEVFVYGVASGQAEATNQQRTADGIVNFYNEEIFGPAPDGNLGFALQRLPGLTVDTNQSGEPTGINIRGVEGNFNSFQINGNRMASAGGRGLTTDQFSSDGISNIEVIKARTPDRDGDAIGGIVNVITRSAFERGGREINLEVGGNYRDLSEEYGHSVSANYSDIFSIGGGDNNLGVSLSVGSYGIDRTSLNRDMDWVQVTPEFHPELNLDQFNGPVWFMESSHWEIDNQQTDVNSVNLDFDYRTDESNSYYFRTFYSVTERTNDVFETDINIDREFENEPGGNTYALLTPTMGRGTQDSEADYGWIGTDEDRETDLYSFNIGGRHETSARLFTWDLFYSRNEERFTNDNELNMAMVPEDPFFEFEYELYDTERGDVRITEIGGVNDPTDLSLMTEGEWIPGFSEETEEMFQARLDYEYSFDWAQGEMALKTGGVYRSSEAEADLTYTVYEMDDAFPYAQVLEPTNDVQFGGPKLFNVFPSRGAALLASNPGLFELNEEDTIEESFREDYRSEEDTVAAYGMGTYTIGRHRIIAGLRYERVTFDNTNFVASFLDGQTNVTEFNVSNDFDFWLPGIHLRHELTPQLILRESYNRSYGRPRRSELATGRFENEDGDIVDGNPNLRPALSDNFDIQLEYYTETGGLYSIGVFYKQIEDFTFDLVYEFNELDANGIPIPVENGDFEYEVPQNGTTADNLGLELIAVQRLDFLPGLFKGLSTRLSATFVDTSADYPNRTDRDDLQLPGFSDFVFAGTLDWTWKGANLRADYIYRSDYVEGLGTDIESDEFFGEEQRLDLSGSYLFSNGLEIFGNVINVTDEPQFSYQGFPPFVEDANIVGRTFNFGARYSF